MQNKFADSCIKNENMSDKQLAEELHKPIVNQLIFLNYINLL